MLGFRILRNQYIIESWRFVLLVVKALGVGLVDAHAALALPTQHALVANSWKLLQIGNQPPKSPPPHKLAAQKLVKLGTQTDKKSSSVRAGPARPQPEIFVGETHS